MIHHTVPEADAPAETTAPETQDKNDTAENQDPENQEEDSSEDAEAAPLPDSGEEE
jgi:hypothetical protein